MLSVEDLSVAYGRIEALHQVSLNVDKGEVVSIIGANGAGKSTLIWTISGCLVPKSGRVLLEGKQVPAVPHKAARMGIALAPERRRLFPNLTVEENLKMGAFLRSDHKAVRSDEASMYELFPRLRERRQQYAGTLSGGEQQMVAIARALMSRPRMLLLDEPSLGLSPLLAQEVFSRIGDINGMGLSILLVEQNAFKALKVARRAYILESGHVRMTGMASELLQSEAVKEAYLGARAKRF